MASWNGTWVPDYMIQSVASAYSRHGRSAADALVTKYAARLETEGGRRALREKCLALMGRLEERQAPAVQPSEWMSEIASRVCRTHAEAGREAAFAILQRDGAHLSLNDYAWVVNAVRLALGMSLLSSADMELPPIEVRLSVSNEPAKLLNLRASNERVKRRRAGLLS